MHERLKMLVCGQWVSTASIVQFTKYVFASAAVDCQRMTAVSVLALISTENDNIGDHVHPSLQAKTEPDLSMSKSKVHAVPCGSTGFANF